MPDKKPMIKSRFLKNQKLFPHNLFTVVVCEHLFCNVPHPPLYQPAFTFLYQKRISGFLLVVTLLWCIIPTFTTSAYQSNPLIEFVLYYSVAGYIKLFGFRSNVKSAGWFGLWFVFCALKYLSCVCLITLGTKISIFSDNSLHFYNRNSILTLFGAVCLFMAFATMKPRSNRFVNTVASATFGVYLLHDSEFFRNFFWNDIFRNSSYQSTPLIIPYSIAVTIAVFIGCDLIDLARQYILEKPVFSLIGRRCERENKASSGITDKFRKILFGKDEIID